ncbi:MAG: hypothetical protein IKT32_05220 [Clostridia bacterium]|nr:hypothetical protein [Clostridia bacterium]
MYLQYSDPKIIALYDKLRKINYKENCLIVEAVKRENPDAPILLQLAKNPHFTHNNIKFYDELLAKYYTPMTFQECVDSKLDKYYADFQQSFIYEISDDGVVNLCSIAIKKHKFTFDGYNVSYNKLNSVKDEIIAERSKFFKNKKKLSALIEEHKKLRKEVSAPSEKYIPTQLDKVFLETFSYTKKAKRDCLGKDCFAVKSGWLALPPYFFDESLYNLKSNDYKKCNLGYYLHFLPKASLALIVKDLQADSGEAFFKSGVTVKDIEEKVKEQAEVERILVSKLNIETACQMFNEKLKTFVPDKTKKSQSITIEFAYMGLDKLDEHGLKLVAKEIFEHYSLFERYSLYLNRFKTVEVAIYNKKYNEYVTSVTTYNDRMKAIYDEYAAALPFGKKDLPYLQLYFDLLDSGRFQTYHGLCDYVADIRYKDEMRNYVRQIAYNQEVIKKQNQVIISNQNKLYEQNERQYKQLTDIAMTNHQNLMTKLDKIENKIKNQEVIIYW